MARPSPVPPNRRVVDPSAWEKALNRRGSLSGALVTTGLHFHDIAQLMRVIYTLRDAGNTLVIIEHNLDVIKTADWIIDIGPEGGAAGGQINATGTPETVAKNPDSYTGQYLARALASAG